MVAELGGVPAGMVSATSPDRLGTAELISMWVAPFARGRGVGDRLVDAVIAGIVEGNPADAPAERRMVRELNLARGET
ncbi:MAG: GNAT family N-acetyltransferase [Vulcanimicrobiaceae bacterium]